MANFAQPAIGDLYGNYTSEIIARLADLAVQFDPALVTLSGTTPTGTVQWLNSGAKWQRWSGAVWADLASQYNINVLTATKWTTARTITLGTDLSGSVTIDGSAAATLNATLATVNSNVGSFGSTTAVPIITVNAKGLVTGVTVATLGSIATQAANSVAITGGAISGTAITLEAGAGNNAEGRMQWSTSNDLLYIGASGAIKTFAPTSPSTVITETNRTFTTGCTWNGNTLGVAYGGTGAATFTSGGLLVGNGTGAVGIATAAQIVAAIGATAVANATAAVSATTATTATKSTNLAGGLVGQIPYQTAVDTTAMLAAGTAGQVLMCNGSTLPEWTTTSSFPSRIINGDMSVDQRNKGDVQTFTGGVSAYCVDRFYALCLGSTITGQRVTGTGDSQYVYQFTGAAASTSILFGQRIEAANIYDLAGSVVTLSVELANSLLTTVTWTAYSANAVDVFTVKTSIATGTFTVNSTPTRYNTQITLPTAAKNGVCIELSVSGQNSGTFSIGKFQLEAGTSATPFKRRSYAENLALCQRYCQVFSTASVRASSYLAFSAGNILYFSALLPTTMRATPAVTLTGATWGVQNSPSPTITATTENLQASAVSTAAGNCFYAGAGGTIKITAEL